jgi:hypothetical protein
MQVSCLSAFDNKNVIPDDGMVSAVLGGAASVWDELRTHVETTYPNITGEWKHYGKAAGWSYKLLSKKRNLLFFVPQPESIRLRLVFGEKACACIEADGELSADIKEVVRAAVAYKEGRSIDIDVTLREQLEAVKRLIQIKFEN